MALSDTEHMAGELVQLGIVASVDPAAATCTVQIGDLVTGQLPWLASRAGKLRAWSPPSVGEQVVVLAPEGDLENAVVLPAIYSDAFAAPSQDPDVTHLEFEDGAVISYNQSSHELSAILPAGGAAAITAPAGVKITGDVEIVGKLSVSGDVEAAARVTADDDVIAAGKSLKSHRHSGVTAGGAQSGPPA